MKYEPRLHVVLFEPEIPHNAGAVGRTCVAVAAKLWLVRPLGFRVDDYNLHRAGLDYWQHLEWEVADDWDDLVVKLPPDRAAQGARASATEPWFFSKKATRLYTTAAFAPGDVFVFGNESQGLPESMFSEAGERALRIPVREEVRSLNLSNAVAVACYEALRQFDPSS